MAYYEAQKSGSGGGSSITVDSSLSATSTNPVQNRAINTALGNKVDKVEGKGLSTNDYDNAAKDIVDSVTSNLNNKVDKVAGKGLSTNDYTTADKAIVDGVTEALNGKADSDAIPTKTSNLNNDSNFVSDAAYVHTDNNYTTAAKTAVDGLNTALSNKQDKLTAGTNITIENNVISATGGGSTVTWATEADARSVANGTYTPS